VASGYRQPQFQETAIRMAARAAAASITSRFVPATLPAFESRLAELGVPYVPRTVPDLREHQIFVTDPNGIRIEFVFASDEVASWTSDAGGIARAREEAST
jgi:deoxyribodipyrimidine photolyase